MQLPLQKYQYQLQENSNLLSFKFTFSASFFPSADFISMYKKMEFPYLNLVPASFHIQISSVLSGPAFYVKKYDDERIGEIA